MSSIILLVDDDEGVLNALSCVLDEEEYVILKTTHPKDVFKILEKNEVHVLISDQKMPEITGCELLKEVKNRYPNIVTVILSAYTDFESIQEAINEGNIYKFLSKPWDNNFLREQVRSAVAHYNNQKSIELEIGKASFLDRVTNLSNREVFVQQVINLEKSARENKYFIALLLIDIDRFGNINNQFGHHIGDQILRVIADRLRSWVPQNAYLARIGNDEFAILFDQVAHVTQIEPVVRKLDQILKQPFIISEREVYIMLSIGIALYPQDSERADVLIEKANIALNFCKKVGGGVSQFYDPEMEKEADVNILMETELHNAVENKQFVNFYQPIVSLKTGKISGIEALVRWQHPRRGLLAPLQFIPLCEKSGLIVSIDSMVLQKGIEDIKLFNHIVELKDLYISSNFSIRHFISMGLKEKIEKLVANSDLPPYHIVIEVTESLLVHHSNMLQTVLKSLHDLGVRLALDDFGTGYASLSYIRKYPFDLLKIDRSYIREIGHSKNDEVLIAAMINMAKSLGQKVVAEGIESQNQIDFLKDKGCDFGQGFVFSQPVSKEELMKKIKVEEFVKSMEHKILR